MAMENAGSAKEQTIRGLVVECQKGQASTATTGDKANSATDKAILTIIDYLQGDVLAENYENVSNYLESLRKLVN